MPRRLLAATIAIACGSGCGAARIAGIEEPATSLAEFAQRLERLRTLLLIPGMAAAIGQDGQVAWQHSFGFADLEARLAVADTTTFTWRPSPNCSARSCCCAWWIPDWYLSTIRYPPMG